jgi:outer membrane protein assembly factor BamD
VVENYQKTTAVPKALSIMARAYKLMGLQDLSDDVVRVLKLNYPNHPDLAVIQNMPVPGK